jgi:hypothetical protein
VPELDVHLLMNHSIPGVNAGYITRNKLLRDHLRIQQEAISRKIVDAYRTGGRGRGPLPNTWPLLSSRRTIAELLKPESNDCEQGDR